MDLLSKKVSCECIQMDLSSVYNTKSNTRKQHFQKIKYPPLYSIITNSGRLHVYVKAESVAKLSQVNPTFVRIGDQGNVWRQGYLPLPTNLTVENFQVRRIRIKCQCQIGN